MNLSSLSEIQAWYERPQGLWVLDLEQQLLQQVWTQCFGYYLLLLGLTAKTTVLSQGTRLLHSFNLTPTRTPESTLVGDFTLLPVATHSVDVVLVHDWLGLFGDPLESLSEIYRVLIPEGRVIICGLRPSCWWNTYDHVRGQSHFPWSLRCASIWQVKKWLNDTGFISNNIVRHSRGLSLYRNSQQPPKFPLTYLGQRDLPFGSGYIMVAQKRVSALTPIKIEWAVRSQLASYNESKSAENR